MKKLIIGLIALAIVIVISLFVRDWHDNSMLPMFKGRTHRTDLLP